MENNLGLIHLYHGDGKGKTSCAIGLCVRAGGYGLKCLWTSFLKDYESGEFYGEMPFTLYKGEVVNQFVYTMTDSQKDSVTSEHAKRLRDVFALAKKDGYDVLVLDEIIASCNLGLVAYNDLLAELKNKPEHLEVILTGRDPAPEVVEIADYVSEIKAQKHPYNEGIFARKGIEY